jgi:subtilisin family serine protease
LHRPNEHHFAGHVKNGLPRLLAALFALFALAGILALGPGAGDHRARASEGSPSVPAARGTASPAFSENRGRIAVKLAPGARLTQKPDGALTVVQGWGALAGAAVDTPGLPLEERDQIENLGIRVLEPVSAGTLSWRADADLNAAVRALRLMPGVLWAEASHPVFACRVPNDPLYPPSGQASAGQWGLPHVGLPHAWDITTGSADVIVAVVDSGLNRDIPDFSGRIVSPYSVLTGSSVWPAWQDNYGHGCGVAGVAVAQGDDHWGIAGAAWNVKVMPVKISEMGRSDDVTLAEGITYAVDHGADVINVSFAGSEPSRTQEEAVAYALAHNVVIVAAAGNDNGGPVDYPAAIPGVIAVGATNSSDARCSFSNTGAALDLVAPGSNILSYGSGSTTTFKSWQGTSFSSPLVAGVVALMRSVNSSLTPGEITDILNSTADDLGAGGWDREFGWGLLDADEAIAEAVNSSTTTTTTEPPSTTTTTTTEPPSTTTTTTVPPSTTTTTEPRFADVSVGSTPYWSEIGYLAARGIVTGASDGLFHPQEALKRQQFAKVIVLALNLVSESDTCPFTDVVRIPGDPYPYHYVAVAYQHGITQGTKPGRFSPYSPLTRAQMITMAARAAQLPEPPMDYTPPFGNFSATHYPFARKAASAGLLDGLVGMGSDYDFTAPATRGEVCALLYRLLQ